MLTSCDKRGTSPSTTMQCTFIIFRLALNFKQKTRVSMPMPRAPAAPNDKPSASLFNLSVEEDEKETAGSTNFLSLLCHRIYSGQSAESSYPSRSGFPLERSKKHHQSYSS
eukprot:TRINITY_DN12468_c0_g2_i1.p1 TRINITY_DN12468_c0_g2~~TRINITY_DN12468_c0_g2_i1.p1  ORF type:complete len:111 (+),score=7.10 TRINITY_DN12468_c0_g2_i1:68-400(+)